MTEAQRMHRYCNWVDETYNQLRSHVEGGSRDSILHSNMFWNCIEPMGWEYIRGVRSVMPKC